VDLDEALRTGDREVNDAAMSRPLFDRQRMASRRVLPSLIREIPLKRSKIRKGDGCIRHVGPVECLARRPLPPQQRHPSPSSPHHLPPRGGGGSLALAVHANANTVRTLFPRIGRVRSTAEVLAAVEAATRHA
jgi:hypothetical protein